MIGRKVAGAAVVALLFGTGCGEVSTVEPASTAELSSAEARAPSAMRVRGPVVFQGEKLHANSVINVLYDWDVGVDGPVVYASRPMGPARWPEHNDENSAGHIYVVVYPVGTTVTGLMCYDTPMEICPDHGPEVSAGAMEANPAVYGGGVLGHDHLSPQRAAHAYAVFVLFTNAEAANNHITTRAGVEAAVASGDAFLVAVPELTFHNAPVDGRIYELASPWVCPEYSFCSPD